MNEENKNTETVEKKSGGDKIIWVIFITMCLMSILVMFSAVNRWLIENQPTTKTHVELIVQHGLFLLAAGALAFGFSHVPIAWYRMKIFKLPVPFLALGISLLLLILLLVLPESHPLVVEVHGARRGLNVFGFTFQAYEVVKLSVILAVAYLLALCQRQSSADKAFKPIAWIISIAALLIFTQNLSTAIIVVAIPLIMMWIGRISLKNILKYMGLLIIVGGLALAAGFYIPETTLNKVGAGRLTTQANRIEQFFEQKDDNANDKTTITDESRQITHSQIAIANGYDVLIPRPGSSTQQAYLSLAYMDFIFSILVEEWGIGGAIFVILLYLILLYRAGVIAYRSKHTFNALLAVGVALIIVLQAFISMAVCVHLGPVTGQPLPLFSWGGTSIVITGIYFGILQGLYRDNNS